MHGIILGIESSCDETSVAIVKDGTELLANIISTQIAVHQKYGGVMPEVASRLHIENINVVIKEALEKANLSLSDIDAIAVTKGPGLVGALHVGLQAAKTLALVANIPLIAVHHLAGHIYANEYVKPLTFPLLAIVVSGGNTELVLMKKHLEFEIVGETKDDAIGECFDKVARVMGLPYPGGVSIDKLFPTGHNVYKLPHPLNDKSYNYSFSGLKTAVINLVHNCEQKGESYSVPDLACSFEHTAIDVLLDKALPCAKEYGVKAIVLAGGVSANSYLRSEIVRRTEGTGLDITIPPLWCTTDNAAMIAMVGAYLYDRGHFAPLTTGSSPSWYLGDFSDELNSK